MTCTHAKKLKESLRAIVRAVQGAIGTPNAFERADHGDCSLVNLIQVLQG